MYLVFVFDDPVMIWVMGYHSQVWEVMVILILYIELSPQSTYWPRFRPTLRHPSYVTEDPHELLSKPFIQPFTQPFIRVWLLHICVYIKQKVVGDLFAQLAYSQGFLGPLGAFWDHFWASLGLFLGQLVPIFGPTWPKRDSFTNAVKA